MGKGRLEAFSDGVFAIIITIMVLELKTPEGATLAALRPMCAPFTAYAVSFAYVGIYWVNHHHLLNTAKSVSGLILWANLALLFALSLVPLTTAWIGEHPDAPVPTCAYGIVLTGAGVWWLILQHAIIRQEGPDSALARAIGRDIKGRISFLAYIIAAVLAFVATWMADAIYVGIALMWIAPDPRIARVLARERGGGGGPELEG